MFEDIYGMVLRLNLFHGFKVQQVMLFYCIGRALSKSKFAAKSMDYDYQNCLSFMV